MRKEKKIIAVLFAIAIAFASCQEKQSAKKYDFSKPVEAIEAISNDVSASSDEWNKDEWDAVADNLETALKSLPSPLADDEATIVSSTLSRMSVYAGRHKRTAASVLEVINSYLPSEKPAATTTAAAPEQKATPVPDGLLPGHVIREGGYTNVRKSPSTKAAIVNKLKDGSPIFYTVYNASWCQVYDASGRSLGFMHSSKVVAAGAAPAKASAATGTSFDWLAQRFATSDDVMGMSSQDLRILRNSIYARHGRTFKDAKLRSFFNSQPWYNGYRDEIPAGEFNKYETYNISFLKKYE